MIQIIIFFYMKLERHCFVHPINLMILYNRIINLMICFNLMKLNYLSFYSGIFVIIVSASFNGHKYNLLFLLCCLSLVMYSGKIMFYGFTSDSIGFIFDLFAICFDALNTLYFCLFTSLIFIYLMAKCFASFILTFVSCTILISFFYLLQYFLSCFIAFTSLMINFIFYFILILFIAAL